MPFAAGETQRPVRNLRFHDPSVTGLRGNTNRCPCLGRVDHPDVIWRHPSVPGWASQASGQCRLSWRFLSVRVWHPSDFSRSATPRTPLLQAWRLGPLLSPGSTFCACPWRPCRYMRQRWPLGYSDSRRAPQPSPSTLLHGDAPLSACLHWLLGDAYCGGDPDGPLSSCR